MNLGPPAALRGPRQLQVEDPPRWAQPEVPWLVRWFDGTSVCAYYGLIPRSYLGSGLEHLTTFQALSV
jgi:hypothetical protein